MWNPPNIDSEQTRQVTARMETTPAFGTPSISVSQQQTPKKFAPVVAPKPKFNPSKQLGDLVHTEAEGEYPPPPPPSDDLSGLSSPPGAFPPPLSYEGDPVSVQMKGPERTLEERRSSLDAEIDSLTSILADLESSSPYKPRNQQNYGGSPVTSASSSTPVTVHKRMVIPPQPPLTATKRSTTKPQTPAAPVPPAASNPIAKPQFQTMPQTIPASYDTPSQPTFSVQAKAALPNPQYQSPGAQQRPQLQPTAIQPQSNFTYGSLQPGYAPAPQIQHPGSEGQGLVYGGGQNTWKPQPSYQAAPASHGYQPPTPKKTYITDPQPTSAPTPLAQYGSAQPKGQPDEELDRLTKKMLYDMNNPPAEEYFGRCSCCGENVVGEGTGCTAMDQVFHVDCFVCITCGLQLRGKPFYAVEKKPYCEPCYIDTLETCTVCTKPIMERILRATEKAYHPHCFICVVCQRSLDGIPFTVDASNNIHCIEDFHKKFAPRCSVCKEPIMPAPGQEETVRIVALDRDFHVQCYRCEDCSSPLSEGDNQGCYPLDGHVLCKSCNTIRIQALTAKATTDL
ncbi:lipoma-preferred partner isoform X2 [Megalops cyprinoides]|nr:lipoma-preferred partner isoform X2 [Megalops cyprinoides]XP_036378237.1 lipoma-preferred partner isoform X2 [Megalops cyprinoides]XP_036378238.1 lipoma-preferred partner isoform X2 [Megalops cyprinoides]XP_036378239.1 lipoma-preferred partner isoform X2 [Megalops cyprinoides]XP_036378240.1 lipoma-preferred partner isoform X2 [Megalops cyprinoides]